jgi:hypothetical protein
VQLEKKTAEKGGNHGGEESGDKKEEEMMCAVFTNVARWGASFIG